MSQSLDLVVTRTSTTASVLTTSNIITASSGAIPLTYSVVIINNGSVSGSYTLADGTDKQVLTVYNKSLVTSTISTSRGTAILTVGKVSTKLYFNSTHWEILDTYDSHPRFYTSTQQSDKLIGTVAVGAATQGMSVSISSDAIK